MTHALRSSALILTVAVWFLGQSTDSPPTAQSVTAPPIPAASAPDQLDADEQELVDFAIARLAGVGIELPDVSIEFPDSEAKCKGFGGLYIPDLSTVRICRPSKTTMIHELAHSWVETTLTNAERTAFLDLRGLETWAGGTEWDERGAEHASEIITWAAMDENISHRWLEPNLDGSTTETWRLFKVPNSDPDQLAAAFVSLTGEQPSDRLDDDPRTGEAVVEVRSPEVRG